MDFCEWLASETRKCDPTQNTEIHMDSSSRWNDMDSFLNQIIESDNINQRGKEMCSGICSNSWKAGCLTYKQANTLLHIQRWYEIKESYQPTPDLYEYYTENFLNLSKKYKGVAGIYAFMSEDAEFLYVGKSVSTGVRMIQSFEERILKLTLLKGFSSKLELLRFFKIYANCERAKTEADIDIVESFVIANEKPLLNKDKKYEGVPTVHIDDSKYWTEDEWCEVIDPRRIPA
jgi:hypothetical protein